MNRWGIYFETRFLRSAIDRNFAKTGPNHPNSEDGESADHDQDRTAAAGFTERAECAFE